MKTKINKSIWILVSLALLSLSSCGENGVVPTVSTVEEYAQVRELANFSKKGIGDSTNVFFDFSCINYATDMSYRLDPEKEKNYRLFEELLGHLTSGVNPYEFYKVDDEGTKKINTQGTSALYNEIKTAPTNEKTKIESALDKIVESGVPSIYITDFEGYDGDKFDESPFASKYFAAWLSAGNKITFIATDYKEKMRTEVVNKWMYITIFDYEDGSLTKRIMESIKRIPSNQYRIFVMSNSFSVSTKYDNVLKGGDYHDNQGNPLVCGTIENGSELAFKTYDAIDADFYPFTVKWEDMKNTAVDLVNNGIPKYKNFLSGLFINNEDMIECYKINSYSIRVDDVQSDFEQYFLEEEKDGKIVQKYGKAPISSVPDLFVINYNNYNSNQAVSEITIDFNKKFVGGTPIGMASENDLLCIRIFVDEVEVGLSSSIFNRSDGNNALEKSVREALNKVKPSKKLVYTYFMKLL